MLSTTSQYDEGIKLPKSELIHKMDLFYGRVQRNPKVSSKAKKYLGLNFAFLKSRFVSESEMQYGIGLLCEFCDDIRSINVRHDKTELKELNPMFEREIESKLALAPEERAREKEKPKVIVDFMKNVRFGGMKGS